MLKRLAAAAALGLALLPISALAQVAFTLPDAQQQQQQRQRTLPPPIQPTNALERALISATNNESERVAFRGIFLAQNVTVAMASAAADARPAELTSTSGVTRVPLFTSPERLDQVLGPNVPRRTLTGRAALTMLRGKNVVLNPGLMPPLTLDADAINDWLDE